MSRLSQLLHQCKPIVKEALSRSFLVTKFLCLCHVTNTYLCSPILVYGPSMLPTLNLTGDVLLVEHLSTSLGKVGPGDVVVVRSPENPRKCITKRILAMGGESVTFLVDPNNSDRTRSVMVPKGHVWIQGDNIYASRDSRQFGPVPYGLIQGKAFWRVWPPEGFGSIVEQ
ncbi:OLC1v1023362C1 [Oldenlandia corymbosa var. corymbosa]|uniref:OLC1v1023362C1 n=1 Tax=Oldenlandia corymbosa var. corymbosa TaxID=529605 RepID=A0AAV1C3G8_OLDCO|nr:OLC1v1023362C1 [Oldenlandia corymbosa var. corymbosa]